MGSRGWRPLGVRVCIIGRKPGGPRRCCDGMSDAYWRILSTDMSFAPPGRGTCCRGPARMGASRVSVICCALACSSSKKAPLTHQHRRAPLALRRRRHLCVVLRWNQYEERNARAIGVVAPALVVQFLWWCWRRHVISSADAAPIRRLVPRGQHLTSKVKRCITASSREIYLEDRSFNNAYQIGNTATILL